MGTCYFLKFRHESLLTLVITPIMNDLDNDLIVSDSKEYINLIVPVSSMIIDNIVGSFITNNKYLDKSL
jgi:hypothetical protein